MMNAQLKFGRDRHQRQVRRSSRRASVARLLVLIVLAAALAAACESDGDKFFIGGGGELLPTDPLPGAATPESTPVATAPADPAVPATHDADPIASLPAEQQPAGELVLLICGPQVADDACVEYADVLELAFAEVAPGPTVHSSNSIEPRPPSVAETRMLWAGDVTFDLSDAARRRLVANTVFPCDGAPTALTLCTNPIGSAGGGAHLAIFMVLDAELEHAATEGGEFYVYAFVFDSDGRAENNYRAGSAFPNDFYDNTDVWYEVTRDGRGWLLSVRQARGGSFAPLESAARAIVYRNTIMLLVPVAEFEVSHPPYRMTSFWHRGDYGMNPPHNWSGVVLPAVGGPLTVPSGAVIRIDE
jgi:hypothetical protein